MVVSAWDTWPVGSGRARVRAMTASILCSIKQLKAAAAPEEKAMPTVVATNSGQGTMPGVARNMPITAVNTINAVTRGLHNA